MLENNLQPSTYTDSCRDGIIHFLETIRYTEPGEPSLGRWKYNAGMLRPYALISTMWAVNILRKLDAWKDVPGQIQSDAIDFMKSCQRPDGFFQDPFVDNDALAMDQPFVEADGWAQMDCFDTLRSLGATPKFPRPASIHASLKDMDESLRWMEGQDWSNPWLVGERWSRATRAYLNSVESPDPEILEQWFGFVENDVLNPVTGYPDLAGCNQPDVAMAGLFKILFSYLAAERSYPFIEAAIDSTLALQSAEGDFAPRPDLRTPDGSTYVIRYARDMCINWDALWSLRTLDKMAQHSYRPNDLMDCSTRFSDCLMRDYRKPDGGFAFAADHCLLIHQGHKLSAPLSQGDIIGTFMCLECFEYTDEWLGQVAGN